MKQRPGSTQPPKLIKKENIFEEIADDSAHFKNMVRQYYRFLFELGAYYPTLQEMRLDDAWGAFRHGKKHLKDSLHPDSKGGDHFKLSGMLAHWLCHYAPVYDLGNLNTNYPRHPIFGELLKDYPSEYPAFELGLYICAAFQERKNPSGGVPAVDDDNFDYYKDICSLLKRKGLSPHSLGMIYRSLFIPLRPSKIQPNPPPSSVTRH